MTVFEVPGRPVPEQRPRLANGHAYTPQKTRDAKARVAAVAMLHFKKPLTGPVVVDCTFIFKPAPSMPKAKQAALIGFAHTQRPDRDNLDKLVLDAMTGIAYLDDAQVYSGRIEKRWGEADNTIIVVRSG